MTSSQRSNRLTGRLFRRPACIGVLVAGSAIFLMAIQNNLFEDRVALRTYVTSLAGMSANAPVRLNGILVGRIDGILLSTPNDPRCVEVEMKIYKRFLNHIPADSKASVYDAPGDKYISITTGTDPKRVAPDGEIQSAQTILR
jgi:ABC-type transporter Mla subunit MlaD